MIWENLGLVDFLASSYGAAAHLEMVAARFELCEKKMWSLLLAGVAAVLSIVLA